MEELWINSQEDWSDFLSFIRDEKLTPNVQSQKDSEGNFLIKAGDFLVHVPNSYELPHTGGKAKLPSQEGKVEPTKSYDPLIFGKDSTENITNITVDNELVYIYKKDGSCDVRDYYNWAIGCQWTEGATRLKGSQYFKFLKELPEDQFYNLKGSWNPRIWTPRSAAEGFMLRSGMTYYKGMKVSDVSLLSLDIEAPGLDKNDPDASVPLIATTYRDRTGKIEKKLFDIFDYDSETSMWQDIEKYIQEKNPDIILGHNIISYDLPYMNHNSPNGLSWGKNGSKILFDEKLSKFRKDGSQQYEYNNVSIHGRDVVDTFFLSIKYDISRDFPGYGLKAIEKHLGLKKEDRSWDFQKWPTKKVIEARKNGNLEIWKQFKEYCQDDSDSPIALFDLMIPSFFYMAQSVPKTLQQMIGEASGSYLDSLMIRSYLQDGYSLPKSSPKEEFEGAISMGIPGNYRNVKKVDVASLYPSIMLQYQIYDKVKDPNCHMLKILDYFRTERLTNKALSKESKYYDDLQNSQKILINSMYGFLGAGYLLFNYPKGAAEVTKHGREILLKGVEWATGHTLKKVLKKTVNKGKENEEEKYHWVVGDKVCEGLGYTLVNVDTDSFSYTNGKPVTKEEYDKELAELNSLYPELIKWEKDGKTGVFEKLVVLAAKNYVLVNEGKLKVKGSSLTDQKKEPRLIKLLEDFIDVLLKDVSQVEKEKEIEVIYKNCCLEILSNFKVKEWCKKITITESTVNGTRTNETKPMDAIKEAIAKGIIGGYQEGDKAYLYRAIDGEIQDSDKNGPIFDKKGNPKMIPNVILRFPELYQNDQDTWFYIKRCFDTLEILENVVELKIQDGFKNLKGEQVPKYKEKILNYSLAKNRELLK